MSATTLRLMNDYKQVSENPPEGISASPISDDNLFVWGL
jgi:ubiquitin-conjugating enzyme E2 A